MCDEPCEQLVTVQSAAVGVLWMHMKQLRPSPSSMVVPFTPQSTIGTLSRDESMVSNSLLTTRSAGDNW